MGILSEDDQNTLINIISNSSDIPDDIKLAATSYVKFMYNVGKGSYPEIMKKFTEGYAGDTIEIPFTAAYDENFVNLEYYKITIMMIISNLIKLGRIDSYSQAVENLNDENMRIFFSLTEEDINKHNDLYKTMLHFFAKGDIKKILDLS